MPLCLFFACSCDSFSPTALSYPGKMRAFALFYSILFCPVWLLFLGGHLFFSEEEMDQEGIFSGGKSSGVWREGELWSRCVI